MLPHTKSNASRFIVTLNEEHLLQFTLTGSIRLYYICASGVTPTHLYHCVDDQLFDLRYLGCNFKELVDCGDRLPPFTCPSPDGKFPITENACDNRYYICSNNNATIQVQTSYNV